MISVDMRDPDQLQGVDRGEGPPAAKGARELPEAPLAAVEEEADNDDPDVSDGGPAPRKYWI